MIRVLPQPSSLPRINAKMSMNAAAENTTSPAQSIRVGGPGRFTTFQRVTASTAMPIGMFT